MQQILNSLRREMFRLIVKWRGSRRDGGASLVEYALLVALIALLCIAAVTFFGAETSDSFSRTGRSVLDT